MSVGSSPARVGGIARVTGRQAYLADLAHDDALHVKLVTVDAARARLLRIDASAALAVPGVLWLLLLGRWELPWLARPRPGTAATGRRDPGGRASPRAG